MIRTLIKEKVWTIKLNHQKEMITIIKWERSKPILKVIADWEQEQLTWQITICTLIRKCTNQRPKWTTVKVLRTRFKTDQQMLPITVIKKVTFVQDLWMLLISILLVDFLHLEILTRWIRILKPQIYWCSSLGNSRFYPNQEVRVRWRLQRGICQSLNRIIMLIKVKFKIGKSKEIYLLSTIDMILRFGLMGIFQMLLQRFLVRIIMLKVIST